MGQFHLLSASKQRAFFLGQLFGIAYEIAEIIWFGLVKRQKIYLFDSMRDVVANMTGGAIAYLLLLIAGE